MTLQGRISVSPNIKIINNARRNEGCQILNSELILFSLKYRKFIVSISLDL